MLWKMLAQPVSSASGNGPEGLRAQQISPPSSWSSKTKSIAARTVGHIAVAKLRSPVTNTWCQTPTATYAQKLLSLLASSMTPARSWIGQEPSARCWRRHQSKARRAGSIRPAAVSAIAHSTWSHGSVCPPCDHGISPDGSCSAAIDSAVCRHCSGDRTPGTPGSLDQFNGGYRFLEIQRDALADQRVQRRFGQPGQQGSPHHVPHQHLVIGNDRRVV